jgi:iron complex transport system substrate-binding protein
MLGAPGRHSSWIQFEELAAKNPEVIMVAPCGFDMERTALELPALTSRPEWNQLEAVRAGRVYLAEGNQYFNRPGPRIAESLEILAEIVHPRLFSFGHEGSGWRRIA